MLGIATIRPYAVLYRATEMPWASTAGEFPDAVSAPKISIMPITVPNRPSSGLTEAMVPRVVRKTLQLVRHGPAGFLYGFFHHFRCAVGVFQAGGKYAAQRSATVRRASRASLAPSWRNACTV